MPRPTEFELSAAVEAALIDDSNAMNQSPLPSAQGEEFRDDLRGTSVAPAQALDARAANAVRRLLPAETLAALTRLDPLRSTLAIAQTLALIALALGAALSHFTWWTVIPAVVLIGTQQHALFVLAHDAAHYRLFESRRLNDLVGRIVGSAGGVSMLSYRVIHRLHHNHLYGALDPDIALHGGYPRGKAYLWRKLALDAIGVNAFKTFAYFFGNPAINAATGAAQRPLDDTSDSLRAAARRDRWGVVVFHVGAPLMALAIGGPAALGKFLVLWTLPLLTVIQPILRLRAICEHGAVTDLTTPLTAARTNVVGPLARLALFPHHVNYHVEHHLFPAVPHYRLPQLHAALQTQGVLQGAEVRSLRETLSLVFAPRRG
jgi:fatty acid desaturase